MTKQASKNFPLDNEQIDLGILLELGSMGAVHAAISLSDVLQECRPPLLGFDLPPIGFCIDILLGSKYA